MELNEELIRRSSMIVDRTRHLLLRWQSLAGEVESFRADLEAMQTAMQQHDQQLRDTLAQPDPTPAGDPPAASLSHEQPYPWELVDDLPPLPEHSERRAAPRRSGNLVSVVVERKDGAAYSGWVLDRSKGGLGLLVDTSLNPGDRLAVRPTTSDNTGVEVEVVYSLPLGTSWRVGLRFLSSLTDEQVQVFG